MRRTRSATALRHTRPLIAAATVFALAALFLTSSAQSAARANATIEEVKSSHAAMISHPEAVTKLIETAAKATS